MPLFFINSRLKTIKTLKWTFYLPREIRSLLKMQLEINRPMFLNSKFNKPLRMNIFQWAFQESLILWNFKKKTTQTNQFTNSISTRLSKHFKSTSSNKNDKMLKDALLVTSGWPLMDSGSRGTINSSNQCRHTETIFTKTTPKFLKNLFSGNSKGLFTTTLAKFVWSLRISTIYWMSSDSRPK